MHMTKAYSGRALESFRVLVNASSFGQTDREGEKAAYKTEYKRAGGESRP